MLDRSLEPRKARHRVARQLTGWMPLTPSRVCGTPLSPWAGEGTGVRVASLDPRLAPWSRVRGMSPVC